MTRGPPPECLPILRMSGRMQELGVEPLAHKLVVIKIGYLEPDLAQAVKLPAIPVETKVAVSVGGSYHDMVCIDTAKIYLCIMSVIRLTSRRLKSLPDTCSAESLPFTRIRTTGR